LSIPIALKLLIQLVFINCRTFFVRSGDNNFFRADSLVLLTDNF
jgi:hypothetical protein